MKKDAIQIEYNQTLTPLETLLKGVTRAGDFHVSGVLETPLPRLEIDKVGIISFPLPDVQAKAVISKAGRAPYGRGTETIIDTKVRRVWQVSPDRVKLGGKSWANALAAILENVTEGLACGDNVTLELYKLLLYDKGSFFLSHRDTEKVAGMFGTLLIVLPSDHAGGELVVCHDEREVTLDLSVTDFSELSYAAFYADCQHEVKPITRGNRLCRVYSVKSSAGVGFGTISSCGR